MQKFCELVRTGKGDVEVTAQDGAIAVKIGAAAEESVRTGLPVMIK